MPEEMAGGAVAVYGSSSAAPEDMVYQRAFEVGAELARRGQPVVTGGYGGVMEAASRGAAESGGEVIGVTCTLFRKRSPNPWLTLEIEEADLFRRTERLFLLSKGSIVLGGESGTLTELAFLWAQWRAGVKQGPVVIWDDTWERIVEFLQRAGRLSGPPREATVIARTALEAVDSALSRE